MCHAHPTELLKYFCQDDEVPICSGCAITGTHKGHAVVSLADAVSVYMCVYMCVCTRVCVHVCVYMCVCTHVCVDVRVTCVYLTVV